MIFTLPNISMGGFMLLGHIHMQKKEEGGGKEGTLTFFAHDLNYSNKILIIRFIQIQINFEFTLFKSNSFSAEFNSFDLIRSMIKKA